MHRCIAINAQVDKRLIYSIYARACMHIYIGDGKAIRKNNESKCDQIKPAQSSAYAFLLEIK